MTTVAENLSRVRERIAAAAARSGRAAEAVRLVAVTKTHPVSAIREALEAGVTDIGENRVQEAVPKIAELGAGAGDNLPMPRCHLIGHLQSNKARLAAQHFDVVHSLDSARLAGELSRHAIALDRTLDALVQVNISGEDTKSGIGPRDLGDLLEHVTSACRGLRVRGLMTMAPLVEDPEDVRIFFRNLRVLAGAAWQDFPALAAAGPPELSMGMTGDFEVAIEEGATMVRIGSAIFGTR